MPAALALCAAVPNAARATDTNTGGANPAGVFLEDMTWTELRDAIARGTTTVLVPIGATEQSGPALTLGKHNVRVRILSERIARSLGSSVVAPVLPYVPEGEIDPPTSHMRFAGTISVPTSVFSQTLEAIARSLRRHGFRAIVFLGDHGGYQQAIHEVARRLDRRWSREGVRVLAPEAYYGTAIAGFADMLRARGFRDDEIGTHAALADTSLQLALAPSCVRSDRLRPGVVLDASVGVYGGSPLHASAKLGALGADAIVDATVRAIREALASPAGTAH